MAKILAVDDDPATLTLVQAALEVEGHTVVTANNGAAAMLAADNDTPDLIVMDVMMPVMDGFQTLQLFKSNPVTENIPVIMLTGRSASQDVARGWEQGVAFYLTKPFAVDELLTAVRRILSVPAETPEEQ